MTYFRWNSRAWKIHNFHISYLRKYCEPRSEIFVGGSSGFWLLFVKLSASKPSYKKLYSENSMMTCLEQRNPRIQSSDIKCYETSSQNRIKERSTTWKLASSRGKPPLHYINEQFLDDTNDKTSFLYIGVHGVTI